MAIEYRTEPEYIEYLDGERHPKVSPRSAHSVLAAQLVLILADCGARAHGTVLVEGDAVVRQSGGKRTKLVPDVSFMTRQQLEGLHGRDAQYPPVGPSIAIEIWSPGDSEGYLARKIERYLGTGSHLVLDVRIDARTVAAFTAAGARTFTEHDRFENAPFPWFSFEVREVFSVLDELPK